MTPARGQATFKSWQRVEIWTVGALIWAQVILRLAFDELLVSALVGLASLGLLVHIATWLIPLLRSRRGGTDG